MDGLGITTITRPRLKSSRGPRAGSSRFVGVPVLGAGIHQAAIDRQPVLTVITGPRSTHHWRPGSRVRRRFLEANFAVSSRPVAQRLDDVAWGRCTVDLRLRERTCGSRGSRLPAPVGRRPKHVSRAIVGHSRNRRPVPPAGHGDRTAGRAIGVCVGDASSEDGEVFVEAVPEDREVRLDSRNQRGNPL